MASILDPFGVKDDAEKKIEEQNKNKPDPKADPPKKTEEEEDTTDYKAKYERFKILDTEEFDELLPIILEEEGDDVKVKIKKVANGYKEAKTKLGELSEKSAEREKWFRENKITSSHEFQERYEKPLTENLTLYNALLGESDKEGKPRREEAWVKFREAIFNKGTELNPAQIKAINKTFSDQYHQKYGEAPELPTIREIMDARDELIDAQAARIGAIANWEKETELRRAEARNLQETEAETIKKAKLSENRAKYDGFKKSLKYDEFETFFEKDRVDSAAEEMRQDFEDAMTGKKVPELEEYFAMLHKARLYDELASKAKEYKSIVDDVKGSRKSIGDNSPPKEKPEEDEPGLLAKHFKLF